MNHKLYCYFKGIVGDRYYGELSAMPAPLREAEIFRRTCEIIPLRIEDGDLIAGRYGYRNEGEIPDFTERTFPFDDALSEDEIRIKQVFTEDFAMAIRFDRGHFCADYGEIISKGLIFYEKKVKEELSLPNLSEEKRILLEAMLVSLDGVRVFSSRFASLAAEMYENGGDPRHLKMKRALERVPYLPAESIYEAISAVWLMHSLIPLSDNSWASISLGRMDSYLYPFYEKSLAEGESRDTVKEYIKALFILLNSYGDGACALNVGGLGADGKDETNDLTYLIIEVEKELLMPSPILAVRVNDDTPRELFDEVIDQRLFAVGQPTFYGELPCRRAVMGRGISEADASRFTVNSCMGLYMCGEEIASMWGCVFNMHLPLELAINYGKPLNGELPIEVSERRKEISCLEDLLSEYEKYLGEILDVLLKINRKNAKNRALGTPNPFISMLTEGCITRGLDRALGAKYNTETVEAFGLVNTANAISAIDTLVFKEKKYTLDELISGAKANFSDRGDILSDIKRCEKYGANSYYADSIADKICEMLSNICKKHTGDNVYFIPSLHTLDGNVSYGKRIRATFDGRRAGEPLAKNAGPANETRTSDPTSLILSAASLPQELFSGGQPIDLYFDRSVFQSSDGKKKIGALIKTYFSLGGLQLQVNSVDLPALEDAYEDPKGHENLVVRIGGYSERFTNLRKDVQKEFIERFKMEQS